MAPKKKGKDKRIEIDSDDDPKIQDSVQTEASQGTSTAAPKKSNKKKQARKKGKLGDWSDEEVDSSDPVGSKAVISETTGELDGRHDREDEEEEDELLSIPQPKPRAKKDKKKESAGGFAALSLEEHPQLESASTSNSPSPKHSRDRQIENYSALHATAEEEEESEATAEDVKAVDMSEHQQKSKKGKKAKFKIGADEKAAPPATALQVARIVSVEKHPNADKLKVCQVDTGSAVFTVVTNAASAREGMNVAFAGPGCKTPGSAILVEAASLRGVESSGMLCSAFDLGWLDEPDGTLVELPDSFQEGEEVPSAPVPGAVYGAISSPTALKGKKKSRKGGSQAAAAAFAALGLADEEGPAPEDPLALPPEGKKKKSRAGFDPDAVLAAATDSSAVAAREEAAGEEEALAPAAAEKKKKGKKKVAFDVDAAFAEATGEAANAPQSSDRAEEPPGAVEANAEKARKRKGKAAEKPEEDLDALLAEFGVNAEAATESKKGKKKKKGKEAAGDSEPVEAAPPEAEAVAEAVGEVGGEEAEGIDADEPEEAEGRELTAAQKKKAKKKAKEKAKKAEGKDEEEEGASAKKGPAKKESAAVRRLREEMERQKAAQEAAQQAEEERVRKEEAAAAAAEEAARLREEDRQRRKEEKAKQRAELKRRGLLLTGKEKVEAERRAAMREQFLRSNPGVELPLAGEAQQKKKVVYGKKKGPPKPQQPASPEDERPGDSAESGAQQDAEQPEQEAATQAVEAEERAAEESEESDGPGWEDLDADDIKLPGRQPPSPPSEEEAPPAAQPHAVGNGRAEAVPAGREASPAQQRVEEKTAVEEHEASSSEEGSSSEESESESESGSESETEESSVDSEEAREERVRAARAARAQKLAAARLAGSAEDLRSPICCILGHVDTGKTKLLDNIRRTSVQEGEAGGITQQIGATYVPAEALRSRTEPVRKGRDFGLKLPGLLIIDTPGHESFTNLRSRGSSLCDIAILVVDIMHGLEPQTIESINLLKLKKTPFIVALNKVDRLFEWSSTANAGIQDSLATQKPHVQAEFESKLQRAVLNLNEQGLNVALYWKNTDPRKFVNIVPTSAITGEGVPDMLQLLIQLTQKMMAERLMFLAELQCTVLEVKVVEGLGTTIDVVLVNGVLHEGDQVVLCGLQGPIVTTIRSLLTPHPLRELRVRGSYLHHKAIRAAQGIKIAAQSLESAVAGTQMLVVQKGDSLDQLREEVMEDMTDIFKSVDKSGEGVCVQASTLGSLEALLEFLRSEAVGIPVSGINIGPVHKKDVMRASTMLEKGRRKFAVILAFDVPVTREAQEQAASAGVRIFTADIIYHLFDQFSAYLSQTREEEQQAAAAEAVFPVILQIMPNCVFNAKDPIVLGCAIEEGIAKVGTPICVPSRGGFTLGKIASMELNHRSVNVARRGESVALKIEASNADESAKLYGRHFDFKDRLVSKISRRSIDLLKQHFKEQMERDDWKLVVKLKKMFGID